MYLSRVEIDLYNRKKYSDLSHVGKYHHWVEECFPNEIENKERSRKLWRVDCLNGRIYLLIVSKVQPNPDKLELYGVKGSGQIKSYDRFLNSLENEKKYRFRVTLNPVVSIASGKGKRGRVYPHVTVEQQRKFLLDRAKKNGFFLEENEFNVVERKFVKFEKANQRSIRLSKVTYEGVLTVKDKDTFRRLLASGFGKKKAYGFGLMTVIPEV